ncbi:GNAT family N-acetyltransferase [Pseudoduganella sp. GCM10020061]|uniref:GNAT family N-acetyltransferase n=1 Tax=Pseudoduganella sp. GCM10020061 TaxID=3317345 RepID=UPI0036362ECE
MDFRPIRIDAAAIAQYCGLFQACFPGTRVFTPEYVSWLYAANPDGPAVGFDAWEGDTLAAHYVCVPALVEIDGVPVRVLLSLNTATHPDFQGKGLFTRLAQMTYDAAAAEGFGGVYGVANANSTPGFLRKLGFTLVRPLEARIGIGGLWTREREIEPSFRRTWSDASLAWRCANPNNRVRAQAAADGLRMFARSVHAALPAYAELRTGGLPVPHGMEAGAVSPVRLYLGLQPDERARYWNYVSIPQRLRPSPLNLIFRSLGPRTLALDPKRIEFSFLDFDAY